MNLDGEEILKYIEEANEILKRAYVPYSKFPVAALLIDEKGKKHRGVNVENASYGLCNCAERTAIFKAVSEGEREFVAIAIVADTEEPVAPCGACRQVMAEFEIQKIIMSNLHNKQYIATLEELLPYSFEKKHLSGEKL